MSTDQLAICLIILTTFALFVWGRWRYDIVSLVALFILVLVDKILGDNSSQLIEDPSQLVEQNYKIMQHLVKAQMPFSLDQLKRLDQSIESVDVLQKGSIDKFGQTYEFGDEFAGLFGFRSVAVNPDRTLKFKVANYQRGVRESRQLFTREALRGGPIEPRDIVDSYINANRSLKASVHPSSTRSSSTGKPLIIDS